MDSELARSLVRWNALALALVVALVAATALGLLTLAVVALGAAPPYRMLELLAQYLPGYALTAAGAGLGSLWAFALVFVLTAPAAWLYYRGVLQAIGRSPDEASAPLATDDPRRATARIDVPHFAAAFGSFCGLALFVATLWLLLKHRPGEPLGPHLALLGEYLPGYRVSLLGAAIGLVELALYGACAFAAVGLVYNRLLDRREAGR